MTEEPFDELFEDALIVHKKPDFLNDMDADFSRETHRLYNKPKQDLNRYLKRLKPPLANSIRQFMNNVGIYFDLRITKEPIDGEKIKQVGLRFRHIFTNGTYDTFFDCGGGEISIGIGNGNYLTFCYND